MKTYEKKSYIQCDIEDLFAFHLDLDNLKNITPPDTKVTLESEKVTPKEGDLIKIKTLKNFIPIRWSVLIKKVQKPDLLVDLAIRSPFGFWQHSHIFTQIKEGICELKDVVEYKPPLYPFGNIFNFFIDHELEKMFTYRHKITKEILEQRSAK